MRVTLFSIWDHGTQPYLVLFKEALERQGFVVRLEYKFNLRWLLTGGRSCDAVHLHSISPAYRFHDRDTRSEFVRRLLGRRLIRPLDGLFRLACFSVVLVLAKLLGKVIVYTVHDVRPHQDEARTLVILRRMAHRVVLSLSDRIHVHNCFSQKYLEDTYGRRDGFQMIPIGNYVSWYPNDTPRSQARRQLGLPEDAFVYLFLGMIRPYKGVDDLIAAFEKADLPGSRLLIVGRVSRGSQEVLELGRGNPVIEMVPEFVPDDAVQIYMNASDVCVLPYRWVTTSSAVMLAWTFGRPVIAPALASFPELVTPQTGILYDPSQPDALGSALEQARRRSWSKREIIDYVRQFDWDALGPQLATLYQDDPGH